VNNGPAATWLTATETKARSVGATEDFILAAAGRAMACVQIERNKIGPPGPENEGYEERAAGADG
jgi:hypothetical protein